MIPRIVDANGTRGPRRAWTCARAKLRPGDAMHVAARACVLEIPNLLVAASRRARDIIMHVPSMQIALSNFVFTSAANFLSVLRRPFFSSPLDERLARRRCSAGRVTASTQLRDIAITSLYHCITRNGGFIRILI